MVTKPTGLLEAATPDESRALWAAQLSEGQFRAQVVQWAKWAGWSCYWTWRSDHSPAGFPDMVLANPQRRQVLYRELKAERGRLRPEQRRWLWLLTECGQDAAVWRPSDVERIQRELGYVAPDTETKGR